MEIHLINNYIEGLNVASSVEEIHQLCDEFCTSFGFDAFLFALRVPTSFTNSQMILINGFPAPWSEHYFELDYLPKDPTVAYCTKNILPLKWHSLSENTNNSDFETQVMQEASDFGLRNGVSVPVHSPNGEFGILSCSIDQQNKAASNHVNDSTLYVQLIANYVHEAVRSVFGLNTSLTTKTRLTDREKECLLWAAEGKTAWETSQILNVSERTVNFHLTNTTKKLSVSNRPQAVAKAVFTGLISPYPF